MIWILRQIAIYIVCYIVLCSMIGSIMQIAWERLSYSLEDRGLIKISYNLMLIVLMLYIVPVIILGTFLLEDYVIYAVTDAITCVTIVLLIPWLAGCIYHLRHYIREKKKIKELKTLALMCGKNCSEKIETYKKEIGVHQNVYVCYHFVTSVPIVFGIINPVILLPERDYTEQELDLILKHELMHIKHHDLLWKRICQIIQILYWWNPITKELFGLVDEWTEAYCDYGMCETFYNKKEYFSIILQIGTAECSFGNYLCMALCEHDSGLKKRMTRMKNEGQMNWEKWAVAILACVCFLVTSVTMVSAATVGFGRLYMYTVWETATYIECEDIEDSLLDYKEMKKDIRTSIPEETQKFEFNDPEDEFSIFDVDIAANHRALSKKIKFEKGKVETFSVSFAVPVENKHEEEIELTMLDEKEKDHLAIGLIDEEGNEYYGTSEIENECKLEIRKDGYYQFFIDNLCDMEVYALGCKKEWEAG